MTSSQEFCPHKMQQLEAQLAVLTDNGHLSDTSPLCGVVDLDGLQQTIASLHAAFPDHFQHMFAVKANAMTSILHHIRTAGMGAEVASPGELAQARKAGFNTENIVLDEPAKTDALIHEALTSGIHLNIDSFDEFDRIKLAAKSVQPKGRIGFRINPQVGAGSIGAMSTATQHSKFGVGLQDTGNRGRLIECYSQHAWLNAVHTHVGSQGCSLELMADGIRRTVDLALDINRLLGRQQIETVDIGGGLSVNFASDDISPGFEDCAQQLKTKVPELFDGQFKVLTEFGRSILAKNGYLAAKVENVKQTGGRHIAICHAGAQIATRTVFMPDAWPVRLSAHRPDGSRKDCRDVVQDIAGPCCFAGDKLATARALPLLERGDYVVVHDTGAYYFSNPFFYNSLPMPAVYGFSQGKLSVLRKAQSVDAMIELLG